MAETAMPVRMRLSRRASFNLQAESRALNGLKAVKVTRPGLWGNPWPVSEAEQFIRDGARELGEFGSAREIAVSWYDIWITTGTATCGRYLPPTIGMVRERLCGRNLACWCPLPAEGEPDHCHASVLLRLANTPIRCTDTTEPAHAE